MKHQSGSVECCFENCPNSINSKYNIVRNADECYYFLHTVDLLYSDIFIALGINMVCKVSTKQYTVIE